MSYLLYYNLLNEHWTSWPHISTAQFVSKSYKLASIKGVRTKGEGGVSQKRTHADGGMPEGVSEANADFRKMCDF